MGDLISDALQLGQPRQGLRSQIQRSWRYVKPDLTPVVKCDLTSLIGRRAIISVMYTDDDKSSFSDSQLREMGKRMLQAIQLSRQNQSQVAAKIGVSRSAMNQYCSGKTSINLHKLAAFCETTRATMDYIVFGSPPDMEETVRLVLDQALQNARALPPS